MGTHLNPTTAVILAAGMGTRLKALGREAPKGFLRLGEKIIIEESLDKLRTAGIERVVLVTGHLSEMYDDLAGRSGGFVTTLRNDVYADSGSGYSLYLAGKVLEPGAGFLLLESDLIYEKRALDVLLGDPRPDIILLSGRTDSGDEVYVETKGGNLVAMAKDRSRLGPGIEGELVGISKISADLFGAYLETAEGLFEKTLKVEYEAVLTAAASGRPIPCLLVPELLWAEIDDENHLLRARGLYAKMKVSGNAS
jgi:2-aminoethylphosphonate-pyruvate transaminase